MEELPHLFNISQETVLGWSREQKKSGGGSRELELRDGSLGEALGFPLMVGLHTAPALDLDVLEYSSHRGLRSRTRYSRSYASQ